MEEEDKSLNPVPIGIRVVGMGLGQPVMAMHDDRFRIVEHRDYTGRSAMPSPSNPVPVGISVTGMAQQHALSMHGEEFKSSERDYTGVSSSSSVSRYENSPDVSGTDIEIKMEVDDEKDFSMSYHVPQKEEWNSGEQTAEEIASLSSSSLVNANPIKTETPDFSTTGPGVRGPPTYEKMQIMSSYLSASSDKETNRNNQPEQKLRNNDAPQKGKRTPRAMNSKAHKCCVCNKRFRVKVFLKRHMKAHAGNKRSKLSIGEETHGIGSKAIRKHTTRLRTSGGSRHSALRKLFRNRHFKNRTKTHFGGMSNSCFVCQKSFGYKAVFKMHMTKTHTAGKPDPFCAPVSNPTFTHLNQAVPFNLNLSINNRGSRTTKEKRYKCKLCEKRFTQSGKLSNHMKSHTGEKPFHCSVCGKDFAIKDNLNIHIKVHTGEKPYKCTVCDKSFRQSGHLNMHMQVHSGVKPHQCSICNKAYSQSGSLISHMKTHTGEKNQHQCTMCDKSFRDSTKLNNHVRTHTGEKPFQCSLCQKSFTQSGDLVRHMRVHTGEKPYCCMVCNKTFSEGSNLNKHMRIHTGERPHQCTLCDKAFSEGSTLKNHMRIHTGDKPFQCSVCKKEFIQSGDLYKHMRTHTGEKPHHCPICGRAFTESSTLKKHMKTHPSHDISLPSIFQSNQMTSNDGSLNLGVKSDL